MAELFDVFKIDSVKASILCKSIARFHEGAQRAAKGTSQNPFVLLGSIMLSI